MLLGKPSSKRRGLDMSVRPLVCAVGIVLTWWCISCASAQVGPPVAIAPEDPATSSALDDGVFIFGATPAEAPPTNAAPAVPTVVATPSPKSDPRPKTVTVKVKQKGKTFYGKPLVTDGKNIAVVRWDGRLTTFPINDPKIKVTKYSNGFKPYSTEELKQRLKKYFGNRYSISTTEHFVVIHPKGGPDFWAKPFERHFQRLNNYFEAHGLQTSEPEFPLIAIVLRSRKEFDLKLDKEASFDKNILGYYSTKSNRITTYAPSVALLTPTGRKQAAGWLEQSTTIVHEVAHQIAFNCGVHNRFSRVPKWTSEGLATLCETRGVYKFKNFPDLKDRVNRKRLKTYRALDYAGKTEGKLLELLQSDRLFDSDPELAYAVSWAISFYLNENRQAEYMNYLRRDALRGDFRKHTKLDRVAFFVRHFGKNIAGLEKRMNLFINAIY
jgi:hypothetical protein